MTADPEATAAAPLLAPHVLTAENQRRILALRAAAPLLTATTPLSKGSVSARDLIRVADFIVWGVMDDEPDDEATDGESQR